MSKAMFMKKLSKKIASFLDRLLGNQKINKSPIIILGNQKSGTSVIAHLLAQYSGLSKTVDIPEIWGQTLENLLTGKTDLVTFARKYPKPFSQDIIKEPNLTFFYQDLKKIHPEASFIFIIRDPRSNIKSILDRLSLPGNLEEFSVARTSITRAWALIFDPTLWDLEYYNHYIDILAARWNLVTKVFLSNENTDNILLVRYEDFVKNKLETIEEIAKNIGLSQVHDIADKVDIQYQPSGNKNISWLDFFGKKNLASIENICGEQMQKIGYLTTH